MSVVKCMICLFQPKCEAYLEKCKKINGLSLHIFCFVCIEKWFKENRNCPCCRIESTHICFKTSKLKFNFKTLIEQRENIFLDIEEILIQNICLNLYVNERKSLQHAIDICNKEISEVMKIEDKTLIKIKKNEHMWRSDLCLIILKQKTLWKSLYLKSFLPLNALLSIDKFVKNKFDGYMNEVYENGIVNKETIKLIINSKINDNISKIELQIFSQNFFNLYLY